MMINRIWGPECQTNSSYEIRGWWLWLKKLGQGETYSQQFPDCRGDNFSWSWLYCTILYQCSWVSQRFNVVSFPFVAEAHFFAISAKSCEIQHLMQENPWPSVKSLIFFVAESGLTSPYLVYVNARSRFLIFAAGFHLLFWAIAGSREARDGLGGSNSTWEKLTSTLW